MTYNLKDFAHASRLFVGGNYRLMPKTGFLFHAFIDVNAGMSSYDAANPNSNREIGLMVKQADLPKFTAETKTLHAYNRPNIVQTRIRYDPVTIVFHDDSANVVRNFWIKYFKHYFRDSDYGLSQHNLPYVYTNQLISNFGLNPRSPNHYLRSIRIYSLHQKRFSEYILVNPIIKSMRFGNHNKQSDSDILQAEMTVEYEAVLYSGGTVTYTNPPGFADLHYDYSKSPIAGVKQMFGSNGLYDGTNGQSRSYSSSIPGLSQYNTAIGINSIRSSNTFSSSILDMTNAFNSMLQQSSNSRVVVPNLAGTPGLSQGPFTGVGLNNSVASLAGVKSLSTTQPQLTTGAKIAEISQATVEAGQVISNFVSAFPPDNPAATATTTYPTILKTLNDIELTSETNQVDINIVEELQKILNRISYIEKSIGTLTDVVNATNEQVNASAQTYNDLSQRYDETVSLPDGTDGKQELLSQLNKQLNFQLNLVRDNTDFYNLKVNELDALTVELNELKLVRDSIK